MLHIFTGPTAVGKTAYALEWAERNDAEIVSCDSLLFYKGMDIGTAKPTKQDMARVRHHGIDLRDASTQMTIREYVTVAENAVSDILSRGKKVAVVGGSGFYLKAFYAPVVDDLEVPMSISQEVDDLYQRHGLGAIVEKLILLNTNGLTVDLKNPRKVLNALKRCLASGKTCSDLKAAFENKDFPFKSLNKNTLLFSRSPEDLKNRVDSRVHQMLKDGLIEEVVALQAEGFEGNPSASMAIGYRETLAWLKSDKRDKQFLASEIIQNTNALIHKQRTWFRHQLPPHQVVVL
ncbi:MAG: tRNA (adenosine(37)-N6)-dimethylallyltransferase MiaA [Verrucomicrobia bacterium GWC2_42_7]|nr:MAG: tRNA (adenosine(37)-N6)-dimethylallyltransferase MiaA [Verrucomicrobia bacterium GWC2_42_7]